MKSKYKIRGLEKDEKVCFHGFSTFISLRVRERERRHANDQNRTVIEPVTKKQKGIIPFDYGSILIMHGCVKDL